MIPITREARPTNNRPDNSRAGDGRARIGAQPIALTAAALCLVLAGVASIALALTVALLDRLALAVRAKLDLDATTLPLASVLEGGSWAAGRAMAFSRRADGSSPIKVVSDGTVF